MTKVHFFGVKPWEGEYIKTKFNAFKDIDVECIEQIISPDNLPKDDQAEILSVFVDSVVNRAVIDALPKLKHVSTRSTGFDHIDIKYCAEKNISVSSVPSYGENTVAEFAFALLLTLSRKIYWAVDRIRETGSFSFDGLQGIDLKGKTLGVVGTGRIGRHSVQIAKGFAMDVVAYDERPDQAFASSLGFKYLSFEELLKVSDIITLHVPYLPTTHHMVNEKTLALMKPTAILINTSRGAVVDTEALARALKEGKLGGAGLDVLEEEGVIKDEMEFLYKGHPEEHNLKTIIANHVLIDMPNVIITPHNAFNTKEALVRILDTTLENISNFLKGTPSNIVKI
ncbi:MAG: hydroxyacid dehydrogenase [Parcubacteria group bacterium GW2011_GWA2_40_8]|nr:MAG: hydroxyacid dehydrogenase [Parcubacteria group bacterium GW2011_GWA2_40_8]